MLTSSSSQLLYRQSAATLHGKLRCQPTLKPGWRLAVILRSIAANDEPIVQVRVLAENVSV